jgi:hypothetical protein
MPASMAAGEAPTESRWLDVDRTVRRRVARAVRSGRAVSDPREAALGVGYADASLDWLSRRGRLRPFHLLLALLAVFELVITWSWPIASLLYPALGFGFLRLRAPALRRRLATAREANGELAAEWGLPPARVVLPGYSWLHPDGRRRRRLVVSLGVLFAVLVGVITAGVAGSIVHRQHWAGAANRVCAREHARLGRLRARQLGPAEELRRRIAIERDALVALGAIAPEGKRTPLESQLIAWRRYEVELDAWLVAAAGDPRVPAERVRRAEARERSRELAQRLGASTCARL